MTRRIAITILLTVWAAIVVAGLAAWLSARQILLSELDAAIGRRAAAVAARYDPAAATGVTAEAGGDRYVVTDRTGRTLGRHATDATGVAGPQILDAAFVDLPEGRFRRLTLRVGDVGGLGPGTLVYSATAAEFDRVLRRLAIWLIACGGVAGAAAAAVAARLARLALRPLSRTADAIAAIDEANLDQRLPDASLPAELRPMAAHLNGMIERLQRAFEQRRRFLADASHELRTPVAAMVTTMEVCLRRPRGATELTGAMETCLAEARHLRDLVQALLRQARADGSSPADEIETFDAARTVSECAELARPLAGERQVRVIDSVRGGAIPVRGAPGRLRSVVLNLVGNAIEYNQPGGTVEVSASRENDEAHIVVSDDGPGIAPDHLLHLFQPFYRVAPPQPGPDGAGDGHLGLGLFLVDAHVKALGGQCSVDSTPGRGTTFHVKLQCAAVNGPGASQETIG